MLKLTELTATTTRVATSLAYVVLDPDGSPLSRKVVLSDLLNKWTALVVTTDFNDDPPSSSTITMVTDQTANIKVGTPIKFVLGGTAANPGTYYAVCTAIAANLLTIAGAPLEIDDGDLTELYYSNEPVIQVDLFVAGAYGDAANTILYADMKTKCKWTGTAANLVLFRAMHSTVASVTQPKVNVTVNAAAVSTNDTNAGITLTTAGTWVDNSAVAINTSNYDIQNGEEIEISVTLAGNAVNEALDLTVSCIFVRQ